MFPRSNNKLQQQVKKKVLHVGCGYPNPMSLHEKYRNQHWQEIRLDINPQVAPDIVADITCMTDVGNSTMDAIWSSHNLEHLFAHEVNLALKEFSRVLKSKGELLITLPDIQSVAKHVAFGNLEEVLYISPAGPITALDVMYGFGKRIEEGHHFMAHKTAFTAQTLGQKIAAAGFVNVKVHSDPVFNLWASANKK